MKTKNLIGLLVLFLLVTFTGLAFAFWDNLTTTEEETITIGEGAQVQVAVTAAVPAGKKLVPAGALLGPNDVNEVVLVYVVTLSKAFDEDLLVHVAYSDVEIGASTVNNGLVNIAFAQETNLAKDEVTVTVTVTLTEPGSEAVYNAIKDQDITFTLTFTASLAE